MVPAFLHSLGRKQPLTNDCYRPILLKKSAMVSTAEKYALEIEFFTLSRGFRAQISRSCAQKGIFSSQCAGTLEGPTFSTQSANSSHRGCQAVATKTPNLTTRGGLPARGEYPEDSGFPGLVGSHASRMEPTLDYYVSPVLAASKAPSGYKLRLQSA